MDVIGREEGVQPTAERVTIFFFNKNVPPIPTCGSYRSHRVGPKVRTLELHESSSSGLYPSRSTLVQSLHLGRVGSNKQWEKCGRNRMIGGETTCLSLVDTFITGSRLTLLAPAYQSSKRSRMLDFRKFWGIPLSSCVRSEKCPARAYPLPWTCDPTELGVLFPLRMSHVCGARIYLALSTHTLWQRIAPQFEA